MSVLCGSASVLGVSQLCATGAPANYQLAPAQLGTSAILFNCSQVRRGAMIITKGVAGRGRKRDGSKIVGAFGF